jgi:hypothetical protein
MNSTYITAFNNIVLQFNEELIKVFPEDIDFKMSKNALSLLKKNNHKKIFELISPHLLLYHEYINNKDDRFFIETDVNKFTDDSEDVPIISKLRKYWEHLSDNNKNNIWNYIQTILKLSTQLLNN